MATVRKRRTGVIYALCTPQGTPFYVGRTVQSPRQRASEHLREAYQRNRINQVHHLLRSTGQRKVGFWVLESDVPLDRLSKRECYWKAYYEGAGFKLLNYNSGGNGCLIQPPHVRAKIAKAAKRKERDPSGRFAASLL